MVVDDVRRPEYIDSRGKNFSSAHLKRKPSVILPSIDNNSLSRPLNQAKILTTIHRGTVTPNWLYILRSSVSFEYITAFPSKQLGPLEHSSSATNLFEEHKQLPKKERRLKEQEVKDIQLVHQLSQWDPVFHARRHAERIRVRQRAAFQTRTAAVVASAAAHSAMIFGREASSSIIDIVHRMREAREHASCIAMRASESAAVCIKRADRTLSKAIRAIAHKKTAKASAAAVKIARSAQRKGMEIKESLIEVDEFVAENTHKSLMKVMQTEVERVLDQNTSGKWRKKVSVDLVHGDGIQMLEPLLFVGGGSDILPESMGMMYLLEDVVKIINDSVSHVNDHITRDMPWYEETFEMLHLKIEGHVHKTSKSTPEGARATSEARAQSVVDHLCMCVNRSYLHAEGFGFSQMKNPTDASMNRRVEISVMTPEILEEFVKNTFKRFDDDGGGSLDKGEAYELAKFLGKTAEEFEREWEDMDPDGGGEVDEQEFTDWFSGKTRRDKLRRNFVDNMMAIKVQTFFRCSRAKKEASKRKKKALKRARRASLGN